MRPETRPAAIVATDRVSDVLARDESLIEVFVRHAPQFERLRNRTIRRVMARMVTIEQAARIGGVPAELLLRDLNDALDPRRAPAGARSVVVDDSSRAAPAVTGLPNGAPPGREIVEVDVREDLRAGREPFSRIMASVGALRPGQVICLRAIFEPVPLFAALARLALAYGGALLVHRAGLALGFGGSG